MTLSRRALLLGGVATAGGALLSACADNGRTPASGGFALPSQTPLTPVDGQGVITKTLAARPVTLDLGGRAVDTWAYGDTVPGPLIRATAGDLLRITLDNELPAETSIHWHGIALRNASDGVPALTQTSIGSGEKFTYEFVAPDPGTPARTSTTLTWASSSTAASTRR